MNHSEQLRNSLQQSKYNYENAIRWLQNAGKKKYGNHFAILDDDKPIIFQNRTQNKGLGNKSFEQPNLIWILIHNYCSLPPPRIRFCSPLHLNCSL